MKIPDPITAPIPSAVSDHGPSDFCNRCPGDSDSEISLSIDLQQKTCLSEVRTTWFDGGSLVVGCGKRCDFSGLALGGWHFALSAQASAVHMKVVWLCA